MNYRVDTELLAALVRQRRGPLTLREAADVITRSAGPVSVGTVLRVEQGRLPDLGVFLTLCDWLQMPPARLFHAGRPAPGAAAGDAAPVVAGEATVVTVARLLRSDKRLDPAMANVLVVMVEATYAQLGTPQF